MEKQSRFEPCPYIECDCGGDHPIGYHPHWKQQQPEALRLADAITHPEGEPTWETCVKASAELRRLHAEVDRLSYRLAYPDNFVSPEVEELRAINAQLLEALKEVKREASFDRAELWLGRINRAVEEEREACAKVCDVLGVRLNDRYGYTDGCAKAIRARQSL